MIEFLSQALQHVSDATVSQQNALIALARRDPGLMADPDFTAHVDAANASILALDAMTRVDVGQRFVSQILGQPVAPKSVTHLGGSSILSFEIPPGIKAHDPERACTTTRSAMWMICDREGCRAVHGKMDLMCGDTIDPARLYDIPPGIKRPLVTDEVACQRCGGDLTFEDVS